MVFRVIKNKNYTTMSNYHLRDKELSLKAKGLLSWMLSNDDDWDYSVAGIVANCKENETAIESALAELKERGYVRVTKLMPNQTKSGRIEYIYDILEEPKQGGDFLPLEFLPVENHPQRNTNKRNTNKEYTKVAKAPTSTEDTSVDNSLNTLSEYESKMYSEDRRKIRKMDAGEKPKKLSLWDKCVQLIESFTDDEKLQDALKEYLRVRLAMKDKPIFAAQFNALLKKIPTLKGDPLRIVKQSTELGYASFYDEKVNYTRPGNGWTRNKNDICSETDDMNCNKVSEEERREILTNGEVF